MYNKNAGRRNYYLMVDTETMNTMQDPIVYDIGLAVVDKKGEVYESDSFMVYETFIGMKELMRSAYYGWKCENYEEDLANGSRKLARFVNIYKRVRELCERYDVKGIVAHNARFDVTALNTTLRFLTNSKYRWFFPYGVPIYDTLVMAKDTIGKQKKYRKFCEENGYTYGKNNANLRMTAEVLYRYISGNVDFVESHTGLEDVMIEKDIFVRCMRQHKKMRTSPWSNENNAGLPFEFYTLPLTEEEYAYLV